MEEHRSVLKYLTGKHTENNLEKPTRRWKNNTRIALKKWA